jgi:hypothetical protein
MNNVGYIITTGCYSEFTPCSIWSSREEAEAHIQEVYDWEIQEYGKSRSLYEVMELPFSPSLTDTLQLKTVVVYVLELEIPASALNNMDRIRSYFSKVEEPYIENLQVECYFSEAKAYLFGLRDDYQYHWNPWDEFQDETYAIKFRAIGVEVELTQKVLHDKFHELLRAFGTKLKG